ncbi:MAG: BrnT family toxin [Acidobacteriota bacterium]|jgi:uncharacterized DUF497 family protein|nr:BrnT family toxin [Acidobacteriota bacterium]
MVINGIEWDSNKALKNLANHRVSFETAQYVFSDPDRLERPDHSNIGGECRWQTIGRVGKVLFVVYTERGMNRRLISARLANKIERRLYHGHYQINGEGWAKTECQRDEEDKS